MVLHGSALKGGAISNSSDIDFKLFLDDEIFRPNGTLPMDIYIGINKGLSRINISPFSYIQCDAVPISKLGEMIGLVKGSYKLISGDISIKEPTNSQLKNEAIKHLENVEVVPEYFSGLLDSGKDRSIRLLRLLTTQVSPVLYHVATLTSGDGNLVWKLPKNEVLSYLPYEIGNRSKVFYEKLFDFYNKIDSDIDIIDLIYSGYLILLEVTNWYGKKY
ncbi:hypothetical protein [Virgibacillus pantothenticus]|uniref:hypothetical protein n=1 Tax=Virgibacillus pantothenticus TaxID=1473 RepID=UPI00098539BB|nr:hypothetical protein [Virgibacillus pantothenticus]